MSNYEKNEPQEFIAGLREMADFFEAHPSLIPAWQQAEISLYCDDPEEFSDKCREIGRGEKDASGAYLTLNRNFGPHTLSVDISKEKTCTKVQTGTTTKRVVVPTAAVPVAQQDDALVYEITEPTFDWVCEEKSWLSLGKEEVAV